MPYRLAIFDFDGTLADSFPFFLSVFNRIADKHGFSRIDIGRAEHMRHVGVRQMMARVNLPAWKLPLASKTFMQLMRDRIEEIALFDGIGEALRALHQANVQIAVVSSNSEHNVRAVLVPELAELVSRFDCGMSIFGKASRLRSVIKQAHIPANEAVYIGDQGTDAEAAHRAGAAFGAVHWGYATIDALRSHHPTLEFDEPADLIHIAGTALARP
jgi:phosphoglycolate phosphatase